jgi:tetratricopeptide (TPR) repeat protein
MKRSVVPGITTFVLSCTGFLMYGCDPGDVTVNHPQSKQVIDRGKTSAPSSKDTHIQQAVEAKYEAGVRAFTDKHYSQAIELENEAIRMDRSFYPAYNVKGIALCYAGNDNYSVAMSNIDRALALNPNYGYARFNKALCEERYGDYKDAIKAYQSALDLKTHDWWVPWAYYGIASIYGRWGDVQNAVTYLKRAIALNPGIKQEARTETDFDNVRYSSAFQKVLQ